MQLALRMAVGCLAVIGIEFGIWHLRGLELPLQLILSSLLVSICIYFAVRSTFRK